MKKMKNLLFLSVLVIFLHSCSKDSTDPINRGGLYEGGYFITNEGNFGTGNGSITYVSAMEMFNRMFLKVIILSC